MRKAKNEDSITKTATGLPAILTQLNKIKISKNGLESDLIEGQVVCLRRNSVFEAFRVDFISSHRPDNELHDKIDMLVISSMAEKLSETLTYWTDYDRDIAIPLTENSHKMLVADFFRPKLSFAEDDQESLKDIKNPAKHCWPAIKSSQEDIVRMEATENGESKFWSIWKTGSRVFYWHGKIGDPDGFEGSYVSTSIRQAGGASAFMQRKIAEKLRKGYVEV